MKRAFVLVCAFVVTACSGADAPANPAGALSLKLTGGGGSDGAVVFVISGGPVTSVDGASGYQVAANADGEGTHVMVVGDLVTGEIARVNIPDLSKAAQYVVTIKQVADRANFTLSDPARYQLSLTK